MRRTLRPLLLALSLVALWVPVAAVAEDSEEISEIRDSRIDESSGLVISPKHEDLAYTINDGDNPIVYAIEISTGNVVGTTRVRGGAVEDTESITIDSNGRMWVADLGDNDRERDDAALYRFPEPGPGDHTVNAKRYPVSYEGGPADIESFLVHPNTGEKFLASRDEEAPGALYSLPKNLTRNGDNRATDLGKPVPVDTSDGTFTADGSQALIRTGEAVHVFDPETWSEVERLSVPEVENGESIAMEPDGASFIIGSEGENSPLIRVQFGPAAAEASSAPPAEEESQESVASDEGENNDGVSVPIYLVVAVVAVGILSLLAVWAARRRQSP
ncbi:hypothetical protein [Aeromicrobium sp.]|uniref:hypothetical protein n=1 Tax=Aeromicrobium sp. TaxID=1871063 RepID=UPI003D6C06E0